MKFSRTLLLSLGALFFQTSTAYADALYDDVYVSVKVGVSVLDAGTFNISDDEDWTDFIYEPDVGHYVSSAIGKSFGGYRLELEISNQRNKVDAITATDRVTQLRGEGGATDIEQWFSTLLVNAYKDFYVTEKLSANVTGGVGVGYGSLYFNGETLSAPEWTDTLETPNSTYFGYSVAYQFGAGLDYELTDNITIDTGYRYLGSTDLHYSTIDLEFESHNITGGVRYSF